MNKTLFLSQSSDQDPSDQPQGEARMREALGLRSDGTRIPSSHGHRPERQLDHGTGNPRRHRFVQEGEVPVEVMTLRDHSTRSPGGLGSAPRHRVDETALAAERMAREQAERAFADMTERLREVQTKLGHAELARDEALALAARRQTQIDAMLAAPPPEPVPAPAPTPTPTPTPPVAPPAPRKVKAKTAATPRPRVPRQKAPKPVKWWIKSSPSAD
jgi:outer membrane biosynthesis protein TonB